MVFSRVLSLWSPCVAHADTIIDSIARSARRQYLIYSETDFELFAPQGRRVAPMGVKFSTEKETEGILLSAKFRPPSVQRLGYRTQKSKFLLRFDQNVEYKRPAGAYPLRDFHKICTFCTTFQDALAVKISLDLQKGLRSYGGFKVRGSGYPQIFSAPYTAKLCVRPQKFSRYKNVLEVLYHHAMFGGLGFHPPPGLPKTLSFLFVYLSVCSSRF